jgi:SAM-dependent methyltransferase
MIADLSVSKIREQYELYPYPERNPEDERRRLLVTWPEYLAQINHYCFRGGNAFKGPLRILVAGGGTGDATIFLAEQMRLRGAEAEVVHLDVSRASMEIAQKRAEIRKLENIRWLHASLLDLPELNTGTFDYISCSGVLHHLPDPEEGMSKLLSVLAPDGALCVMVYGRFGRTGVYQMQEMMRLVNRDSTGMPERLANAKAVLAKLPSSNWWPKGENLYRDVKSMPDAEVYDLFLHSQDRAYSVPELYEWIEQRCRMHIQLSCRGLGQFPYAPENHLPDPAIRRILASLPKSERQAIAELAVGNIDRHFFFATRSKTCTATIDDLDNVPFFFRHFRSLDLQGLCEQMKNNPGKFFAFRDPKTNVVFNLQCGKYSAQILRRLDGERSLRDIFRLVRSDELGEGMALDDAQLIEEFRPIFELFNAVEGMLLRHRSVSAFPEIVEI